MPNATIPQTPAEAVNFELVSVVFNYQFVPAGGGETYPGRMTIPASKFTQAMKDWIEAKIKAHLERTKNA
jgi:hypothetical protein